MGPHYNGAAISRKEICFSRRSFNVQRGKRRLGGERRFGFALRFAFTVLFFVFFFGFQLFCHLAFAAAAQLRTRFVFALLCIARLVKIIIEDDKSLPERLRRERKKQKYGGCKAQHE